MTDKQVIRIAATFYGEMNNGGFLQYFANCDGQHLCHIVEYLRKIGADDAAALCACAIASLPCALPEDLSTRRQLLSDKITPKIAAKLEEFDSQFNLLSDNLNRTIASFIDARLARTHTSDVQSKGPKDLYTLIVQYAIAKSLSYDDLADPVLVRKANRIGAKLRKLDQELFASSDKGQEIIQQLLQHEDPRVRIHAGAYCIMAEIMVDEGCFVLSLIAGDKTLPREWQFEAKNCLKYCKPYCS